MTDADIKKATELITADALIRINSYLDKLYSAAFTGLLYDADAYKLLLQLVAGITSGSFNIYPNNEFTGLNMPVSTIVFDKSGFDALKITTGQSGGAMAQLDKHVATQYADLKGFTRIICSHKPQGYVGVKVKFGNQLYYCVDVSKIDEQKYNIKTRYGCCFLVIDLAKKFEDVGVAAIIYTDINRDGTGDGVDFEGTKKLTKSVSIPIIASGGVGSIDDVAKVRQLNINGLIIGRALYDGKIKAGELFTSQKT